MEQKIGDTIQVISQTLNFPYTEPFALRELLRTVGPAYRYIAKIFSVAIELQQANLMRYFNYCTLIVN